MERNIRKIVIGLLLVLVFIIWTFLVQNIDVGQIGPNNTSVGFSLINKRFHDLTGVDMPLYIITDWLGIVPFIICGIFGLLGLSQLINRKNLFKVDYDITILGIYYIIVISVFVLFNIVAINYRPILIENKLEISYPSSTTLLVISVMPTLKFQIDRRINNRIALFINNLFVYCFITFMVVGRLVSGVHWFTDIIGATLIGVGLFLIYDGIVDNIDIRKKSDGII